MRTGFLEQVDRLTEGTVRRLRYGNPIRIIPERVVTLELRALCRPAEQECGDEGEIA